MIPYAWLADAVLIAHGLFVLFVVGGQVLILLGWWRGWHWPRHFLFRVAHLAAIGFVVVESWIGLVCPLTALENWLRKPDTPADSYETSFIGYWVQRLLYYTAPEWVFALIYTLFALIVVASFLGYPPRRSTRHKRTRAK
jgi:polyferredoxin